MSQPTSFSFASFCLATLLGGAVACTPSVEVLTSSTSNSAGSSGAGGAGTGTGSTGSRTTGTTGSTCSPPDLVGDLNGCPAGTAPGGPSCGDATVCDSAVNRWQADCTEAGCSCKYNDEELCACAFDTSPCAGVAPDDCCAFLNGAGCCPYPWLNHPACKRTGDPCTRNADCCAYLCTDGTCDP